MASTDFNLQHAIDAYISNINNQGSLTNTDAMELTAHLYDATADLQQNNLTEEEAFLIACKRLGKESVLTEEYGKVNPSLNTNKTWAYLFIGFNALYTLPSFLLLGIIAVYYGIHFYFNDSNTAYVLATLFHLVFIAFVWYIVKQKNTISQFIEKQVNKNAMRITLISTLTLFLFFVVNSQFRKLRIDNALFYPMREWNSGIAEFTYYMATLSLIGGVMSLIFTVNNSSKISLKRIFEKPSTIFLICFGVFIELMAASTRVLNLGDFYLDASFFGSVYLMATFLIVYYNKLHNSTKYILLFIAFGLTCEVLVGIDADRYREVKLVFYYVPALLIGVLIGRFLGLKYGKTKVIANA